ncbi:MAG: hypothetical protein KZQ73_00070 [Candidatus Thiodiazotropha sp. (ex Semelilucina semeliformis)]|nr:hypothetical protein [Candidatus Thiodiazotropha sp. (ex Myrtea spinifera)]MCU7806259.1 hypothetical protein [Candidatus Thiodiazotropha sp. (ex Semelilucina semeliformis)]
MKRSMSQSQLEQPRGSQVSVSEENSASSEGHRSEPFTDTYEAILARELLIDDFEASHSKYY